MYNEEEELFYVQDSRTFVGNNVMWWKINGNGYTTNLDDAMIVNKDWTGRASDILRPKLKMDAIAIRKVDMQLINK